MLDVGYGQLQDMHKAGSHLEGSQKLCFFDPWHRVESGAIMRLLALRSEGKWEGVSLWRSGKGGGS